MMRCQVCNRSSWSTVDGRCGRCRTKAARQTEAEKHIAWYERTGHCGACGEPGVFCLCTESKPCGCRALHEMGSGRVEDALDQFSIDCDTGDLVPTVSDEQGELFA